MLYKTTFLDNDMNVIGSYESNNTTCIAKDLRKNKSIKSLYLNGNYATIESLGNFNSNTLKKLAIRKGEK